MDKRTLKALKGSIKKWENIVSGSGSDNGGTDCPLCAKFCGNEEFDYCMGCPVMEKTGLSNCGGSPWIKWAISHSGQNRPWMAKTKRQKDLARAELDFLRSLLPKEKA